MDVRIIYTIAVTSTAGLLILWKVVRLVDAPTRRILFSSIRKKLVYTIIYRRRKSTDNVNVLSCFHVFAFTAANIVACRYGLADRNELAKRCAALFLVNIAPLLLGGQTSFLASQLLRISPGEQSLLHRWMGRICVIQGLVHGALTATSKHPLTVLQILLVSLLGALGTLSVLYIRRYVYELFLKAHLLFALTVIGLLWFHIPLANRQTVIYLGVVSGLWIAQQCLWLIRLGYRNLGTKASKAVFTPYRSHDGSLQAMDMTVSLNKPWKFHPGQYVYLTLPGMSRHHGGFIQAHPYMIAWVDGSDVTVLIQRDRGFSNYIFNYCNMKPSVIVDGPYGCVQQFESYDKVLFIASGIGISAHLLAIKGLLEAHNNQSARVRRITLVWFLETADQEQWASHFLLRLQDVDVRNVFTLAIYAPPQVKPYSEERRARRNKALDLSWYIDTESQMEAGNMAVSVCGVPHFEEAVRRGVRRSNQDIYLSNAVFQPEETKDSRASRTRYS